MTGTLTVLGRNKGVHTWDTDSPASIEAAKRAYAAAKDQGSAPFDTSGPEAKPLGGTGFAPGEAETPEDVTMVPRFAGGR
jgi:hypothetical protein